MSVEEFLGKVMMMVFAQNSNDPDLGLILAISSCLYDSVDDPLVKARIASWRNRFCAKAIGIDFSTFTSLNGIQN